MAEVKNQVVEKNLKKGKAAKGWAIVFFIFTVLSLVTVFFAMLVPFIPAIFGIISVLIWFLFIVLGTIFTLGLMWSSAETKTFNQKWMDLNNSLFGSTEIIYQYAVKIVPVVLFIGVAIVLTTWAFMIVGLIVDENRKRWYKGMTIALGILSFFFLLLMILAIVGLARIQ